MSTNLHIKRVGEVKEQGFGIFIVDDGGRAKSAFVDFSEKSWWNEVFMHQQKEPIDVSALLAGGGESCVSNNGKCCSHQVFFKSSLYVVSHPVGYCSSDLPREIALTVKRHVLLQDKRLAKLVTEVEALERIESFKNGYKRESIPDAVRLAVFERDQGRCVKCGSSQNLHFDHIIPVAKGGGNSEKNVQLLCERCNLTKGSGLV